MRKKIIAVSVVFVVLAMLCAQPVYAAEVKVYAWTDKPYYDPGEKGKLKISVLNGLDVPVMINNITIMYPWKGYDADTDKWIGNKTIRGEPMYNMASNGSETDHYYTEVEFTVPNDGRAAAGTTVIVAIGTTDGTKYVYPSISVTGTGFLGVLPTKILGLDTWMTSAAVFILICTIIIALAIFLAARRAQGTRIMAPPLPRSKAKD